MTMARWDPFREARRMESTMDRLMRSMLPAMTSGEMETWSIAMDVIENEDSLEIRAMLPGVDPDEIDISIEDNVLTISAEHREEEEQRDERYLMKEIREGFFRRSLRLPNVIDPDKAETHFENGALTVRFPKQEQSKARRIQVQGGQGRAQLGGESRQQQQGGRQQQGREQKQGGEQQQPAAEERKAA